MPTGHIICATSRLFISLISIEYLLTKWIKEDIIKIRSKGRVLSVVWTAHSAIVLRTPSDIYADWHPTQPESTPTVQLDRRATIRKVGVTTFKTAQHILTVHCCRIIVVKTFSCCYCLNKSNQLVIKQLIYSQLSYFLIKMFRNLGSLRRSAKSWIAWRCNNHYSSLWCSPLSYSKSEWISPWRGSSWFDTYHVSRLTCDSYLASRLMSRLTCDAYHVSRLMSRLTCDTYLASRLMSRLTCEQTTWVDSWVDFHAIQNHVSRLMSRLAWDT